MTIIRLIDRETPLNVIESTKDITNYFVNHPEADFIKLTTADEGEIIVAIRHISTIQ